MRYLKLSSLLLVVVLLAGCLSARVDFTVSPQQIEIKHGQEVISGLELQFRLSGFSTNYQLDKIMAELVDDKGETLYERTEELNESIPVVPLGTILDPIEFPDIDLTSIEGLADLHADEDVYNEVLVGKKYKLKLTLLAKRIVEDEVEILFK